MPMDKETEDQLSAALAAVARETTAGTRFLGGAAQERARMRQEELVWCAGAVVTHWRHKGFDDTDGCLTVLFQYLEIAVQGLTP
jgi:hypothetical protein